MIFGHLVISSIPVPKWILDKFVHLLVGALGVALSTLFAYVTFTMTTLATTADVETMTAPLATKAAVAALPTRAEIAAVETTVNTLRETVAALGATVSALGEAVNTQRETINTLSEAVNTQRDTVGQVNNTVIALSGTVDRVNEAAVRMDGAVDSLGGRLDSLSNIVSPLVPCIIGLIRPQTPEEVADAFDERLPVNCERARDRARDGL